MHSKVVIEKDINECQNTFLCVSHIFLLSYTLFENIFAFSHVVLNINNFSKLQINDFLPFSYPRRFP